MSDDPDVLPEELSAATRTVLETHGYTTRSRVAGTIDKWLRNIPGMGPNRLAEVRRHIPYDIHQTLTLTERLATLLDTVHEMREDILIIMDEVERLKRKNEPPA